MRTTLIYTMLRAGHYSTKIKRSEIEIIRTDYNVWKVYKNGKEVITQGGGYTTFCEAKEFVHFCMQP